MKMRKTIVVIILLLVFSLACSEPVNLSTWLAPSRESLREIFTIMGAITPQVEEDAKVEQTVTVPAAATADSTAVVASMAAPAAADAAEQLVTATAGNEPAGKIIFVCQVDNTYGHDQLCMINADGSGFTQLTNDLQHQHLYPSWAPDGQSFVFSGSHSGTAKIYEMDLQGNLHIVGDIEGELYAPMISPDGQKIVFQRYVREDQQFISVMDRDGGSLMDLVEYDNAKDPVWSTDGRQILFSASEEGIAGIYYMNSSGITVQQVSELGGLSGRPDWSLDWAIATYSGDKDAHNREIVVKEMGGTPLTITSSGDNLSPSFSPDGQWITFMSYRDNYWKAEGCEIYIMRKDGTDVRRLTENTYCDYQPRWRR